MNEFWREVLAVIVALAIFTAVMSAAGYVMWQNSLSRRASKAQRTVDADEYTSYMGRTIDIDTSADADVERQRKRA